MDQPNVEVTTQQIEKIEKLLMAEFRTGRGMNGASINISDYSVKSKDGIDVKSYQKKITLAGVVFVANFIN